MTEAANENRFRCCQAFISVGKQTNTRECFGRDGRKKYLHGRPSVEISVCKLSDRGFVSRKYVSKNFLGHENQRLKSFPDLKLIYHVPQPS